MTFCVQNIDIRPLNSNDHQSTAYIISMYVKKNIDNGFANEEQTRLYYKYFE